LTQPEGARLHSSFEKPKCSTSQERKDIRSLRSLCVTRAEVDLEPESDPLDVAG